MPVSDRFRSIHSRKKGQNDRYPLLLYYPSMKFLKMINSYKITKMNEQNFDVYHIVRKI